MSLQTDLQLERLRRALRVRDHWRLQVEPTVLPVIDVGEHIRRELDIPPLILPLFESFAGTGPIPRGFTYTVPDGHEAELLCYSATIVRETAATTPGPVTLDYTILLPGLVTRMIIQERTRRIDAVGDSFEIGGFVTSPTTHRFPSGTFFNLWFNDTSIGGQVRSRSGHTFKLWTL